MTAQQIVTLVASCLALFVSIVGYILVIAKMKWELDLVKKRLDGIVSADVCDNHSKQLNKLWDKYATEEVSVQELQHTMARIENMPDKMEIMDKQLHEVAMSIEEIKGELKTLIRMSGGKRNGD